MDFAPGGIAVIGKSNQQRQENDDDDRVRGIHRDWFDCMPGKIATPAIRRMRMRFWRCETGRLPPHGRVCVDSGCARFECEFNPNT